MHAEAGCAPATAVARVLQDPASLVLVAQPIVDLETGVVAGFEALSRVPAEWGVAPDTLFAAARASGDSAVLAARTVTEALRLLDELPPNTFLTVNVDPGDLSSPEVLTVLESRPSLAPLFLEITEHQWPGDGLAVDAAVAALRERGAHFAADDVGAGYAGLGLLLRLRPEIVKIDRGLLEGIGRDPAAEALVVSLGALCSQLDAWVIAEGVETELQLAALMRMGVPLGQGWLFARAEPPFLEVVNALPVHRRLRMLNLDDVVATVAGPCPAELDRDEHGRYWLPTQRDPLLTLGPDTPLNEAAQRALSRPDSQRWSPLLVTNSTGGATGVVTMESLVAALAAREG